MDDNLHKVPQVHHVPRVSFRPRRGFLLTIMIITGIILVWRGLWNLIDMYAFPNHPILSNVIGILVGLILLYLPDENLEKLM